MGTDVHAVFQKRTPNGWEDVPTKWDEGRHYFLFSVLADVRNGYGFAGVPTYDPIKPIAKPRGLPVDFEVNEGMTHPLKSVELLGSWAREWHEKHPEEPLDKWMGDHSHSWLTADEILKYAATHSERAARHTGVMEIADYNGWDKTSPPDSYSGGVMGQGVQVNVPAEIDDKTTHVQVSWVENAMGEISYFLKEVQRLKDEHGDVRLVFGFDS